MIHRHFSAVVAGAAGAGTLWVLQTLLSAPTESDAARVADTADQQQTSTAAVTSLGDDSTATEIANLQALIRQQQNATLELQRKLADVQESQKLMGDSLQQLNGSGTAPASLDSPDQRSAENLDALAESLSNSPADLSFAEGFGRGFTAPTRAQQLARLESAGLDSASADDLITRLDQQQLAELELRDEAARGGWLDSDEYREQAEQLESTSPDIRAELGDPAYDRYLFASGRANRVKVENVLTGSAADRAGLLPGDLIFSYADARVFRLGELQRASRSGVRGESVRLSVTRGAEAIELAIERGPLGVSLGRDRVEPQS